MAEEILPETQCGFRPSRGTSDMIFTARQLQEKCYEQHKPLYMAFIDLVKAFDSVDRDTLWKLLALHGCPEKFIKILRLLHDDMTASVITNGTTGEPFEVRTGVKQGCVIAPTLFAIYISTILRLVEDEIPPGIQITYRMDGKLFNLSRLKARTKTLVTSIMELQYADDNAILSQSEEHLQTILNSFTNAYQKLGLKLNIQKTKILYQPVPGTPAQAPNVTINSQPLENVECFAYLGSHLSEKANVDAEINYRVKCAGTAFGRLRLRIFNNNDISCHTKILVYKAVVIPTLLYACETWTLYRRHVKSLEKFHQRCLRNILKITWRDKCTNISVLEKAGVTSIEALLIKQQLRWIGHVIRMPDHRIPKQVLYSELTEGNRHHGGQRKRYKDCIKATLKKCSINTANWETRTVDRLTWRNTIHQGVADFEDQRRRSAVERRLGRKQREALRRNNNLPADASTYICHHCGRTCNARIGLISHLKTQR